MYSRAEAQQIKQEFWTTFGQWSAKKRKHNNLPERWLLNKTGVRGIRFRFSAEGKEIGAHLDITEKDAERREALLMKIRFLRSEFEQAGDKILVFTTEEPLINGAVISWVKSPLSLMNREQWPDIFHFFFTAMTSLESVFEANREVLSN